ncbi:MAG: hypothetical protein IPM79_35605 [Polyangiaceae bacterium]|nr:hypothetical protein [Polyangiaceae bacterium]MBK8942785.1 hypothetical protein [Polyangiaceae bacterium]
MSLVSDALTWGRGEFSSDEAARANAARAEAADQAEREAVAADAFRKGHEQMMALNAEIAAAASVAAAERASVDLRKQALYDTVFLIGAADGSFSDSERAKLAIGLQGLLGDGFDTAEINQSLETARVLRDEKGVKGVAEDVAARIPDERERACLLTIASTVAWLGGGVGTKEGLALQAIAAAFGLPINKLHEIMGAAAKIAKS